ncbi:MAG: hypothetical protein JO089_06140 [Alphaproteobacteria bacterium]|nr:hypothetical protein [Alphaproteobacteria bacterium]
MSDDQKQSIAQAAAQTAVGGTFGAGVAALTGAVLGAIPGALIGALVAGFSHGAVPIGGAMIAGTAIGGSLGAVINAVPGMIAGAVAGFRNTIPPNTREEEHQMELSRTQAESFVQGLNTAGLAMVADRQEALAAQQEALWVQRTGRRKPPGTLLAEQIRAEQAQPASPEDRTPK